MLIYGKGRVLSHTEFTVLKIVWMFICSFMPMLCIVRGLEVRTSCFHASPRAIFIKKLLPLIMQRMSKVIEIIKIVPIQ